LSKGENFEDNIYYKVSSVVIKHTVQSLKYMTAAHSRSLGNGVLSLQD